MGLLRGLLRLYSWIFEALLCLLAIGVAIVSLTVGAADPVHIDWLPWSAAALPGWLIGIGILGLLLVLLALLGRLRILLFLFAAFVFALLVKGLFLGTTSFEDAAQGRMALWLVLAALLALIGAWPGRARDRDYRSR